MRQPPKFAKLKANLTVPKSNHNMHTIFLELTVILILAGVIAMAISLLKQPAIIAYLLTGLIIGPLGYYHLRHTDILQGLGEIGITLLLFLVGLELDINQIKKLGGKILAIGLGQVALTSVLAYGGLRLLGFPEASAGLLALALSLSSTIIVVKLLNDKQDLHSLYGKIVIGILLLQDFAAIFLLVFLSSTNSADPLMAGLPAWQQIFFNFIKILLLIWLVNWQSKYVLPWVLKFIGKSDELLLVFSLAWSLGLAAFVSLPFIGFNLEIGGFLAGLALASTAVHYEIGARIKSLRDFFLIIFFIILGSGLAFNHLNEIIVPALLVTGFVIIIKPLIVMVLVGLAGFKPRTGLMTALPLSQVSEFSLILAALGLKLGYIDEAGATLLTVVAILSIITSSYSVAHAERLYEWSKKGLAFFDFRRGSAEKGLQQKDLKNHIIIVGAHRMGRHIVNVLARLGIPFIVVDQNPEVVDEYHRQNIPAMCGDIGDSHIQELAGLARARLVISTVPVLRENEALLETIQTKGYKTRMIMTARDEDEALSLYAKNIDYVLLPHFIGGLHLAKILEDDQHLRGLGKLRRDHLKTLRT